MPLRTAEDIRQRIDAELLAVFVIGIIQVVDWLTGE